MNSKTKYFENEGVNSMGDATGAEVKEGYSDALHVPEVMAMDAIDTDDTGFLGYRNTDGYRRI